MVRITDGAKAKLRDMLWRHGREAGLRLAVTEGRIALVIDTEHTGDNIICCDGSKLLLVADGVPSLEEVTIDVDKREGSLVIIGNIIDSRRLAVGGVN